MLHQQRATPYGEVPKTQTTSLLIHHGFSEVKQMSAQTRLSNPDMKHMCQRLHILPVTGIPLEQCSNGLRPKRMCTLTGAQPSRPPGATLLYLTMAIKKTSLCPNVRKRIFDNLLSSLIIDKPIGAAPRRQYLSCTYDMMYSMCRTIHMFLYPLLSTLYTW
jgi:hypothetical protein